MPRRALKLLRVSGLPWRSPSSGSFRGPRSSQHGGPLPVFFVRGPAELPSPHRPGRVQPNVPLPLTPGRTSAHAGTKDGQKALNLVAAASRTKKIDGVTTRVVEDRLYLSNVLDRDYYAQDRCGNVWYFGEDTAELDRHGNIVSTEGSFHAGVDGAQPQGSSCRLTRRSAASNIRSE